MSKGNGYTPIQAAMLKVLSDGRPHTREELHGCCGPSSIGTVPPHICFLRKKLRLHGQDIVSVHLNGKHLYQHVRLLISPYV